MGVGNLSKLIRDSKETPDTFASSSLLHGKRIDVDLSVVLHKAIGTETGAGEFLVQPEGSNSEVIEKCSRLCGYAKRNKITLVVCLDGKYHPMKDAVNAKRSDDRRKASSDLSGLLASPFINNEENIKQAKKLIIVAAHVSSHIIANAAEVFVESGHEVYGAPYEADFQLVHWERIGFTQGTYTIDSDIFVMGSNLVVDLLNFKSADGKCKIIVRDQVLSNILPEGYDWNHFDHLLYASLCGCDFIPRLFRMSSEVIDEFIIRWKCDGTTESLNHMLLEYSKGKYWPSVNKEPKVLATNFVEKVNHCLGLLQHAPVACKVENKWQIVPMSPIPNDADWTSVIGFDPIEHFGQVSVEGSYFVKVWARTNQPLPKIQLPVDPKNPMRRLPHGAYVDFKRVPIPVVPASILMSWLYYHGIPMLKESSKTLLIQQVQRAIEIDHPLDDDCINSSDASTARSYVSSDNIKLLSGVGWENAGDNLLQKLRSAETPTINATYINTIFGRGMNGIRERAWLRLISGHLNIQTLRFAQSFTMIEEAENVINIFEIKVTPSMKNVAYSVYVVFTLNGVYIPKLSRCDCPDGWLFCSHTLATFLLIYLIHTETDWKMEQTVEFMPVPIKSLQSVPIAASYVFRDLQISQPGSKTGSKRSNPTNDIDDKGNMISNFAKDLASEVHGYSESINVDESDALEEGRLLDEGFQDGRRTSLSKVLTCVLRLRI